jgi:hypothetical protein
LGINERGVIKYYLEIDSKIKNLKANAKEMLKQKKLEISTLFNKLINK